MECPGLNGLWIACPTTIDGLTPAERALFQLLGEPIVVAAVLGVIVLVTLIVLVASDGLQVGRVTRSLPREADIASALGHARRLRRTRAFAAAGRTARTAPAPAVLPLVARGPARRRPRPDGSASPRSAGRRGG